MKKDRSLVKAELKEKNIMISLTALIRVKKGSEETMKAALSEIVDYVRENEPGTVGYFVGQGLETPNEFVTYERYMDRNAMDLHNNSQKVEHFFEIAHPILEGEAVIRICEEVSIK